MDQEIEKKIKNLEDRITTLENEIELLKNPQQKPHLTGGKNGEDDSMTRIRVPEDLVDKIENMIERVRFPVLWYFSNKQIMSVKEFLNICAETGFSLGSSWLPSVGGTFLNRLVKEDKMFRKGAKVDGEQTWELTDIGKLKVKKILDDLKSR